MSTYYGGSASGGKGGMSSSSSVSGGKGIDNEMIKHLSNNLLLWRLGAIWLIWEVCK